MVYLDYAANSPIDKQVLDTFYDVSLKYYANPNSTHKLGIEAKNIIDEYTLKLEEHEIYISSKTSCCPTETPSKLVYALTHDKELASTSVRISLSHLTTEKEINEFLRVFDKCYKELL